MVIIAHNNKLPEIRREAVVKICELTFEFQSE